MTFYAFIGDSIGFGNTSNGVRVPFPTRFASMAEFGAGNYCISGGRYVHGTPDVPPMWDLIKGYSEITHLVMQGGVNDLRQDVTGAALFAAWEAIADEAIGLGLSVIGCTVTPWGNYVQWTSARQTETDAFNASVLGKIGITTVDLFDAMGDSDPNDLLAAYNSGDGLHPNEAGTLAMATEAITALGL